MSTYSTNIMAYKKHIAPYFDEIDIEDINIPFLKKYRENLLKNGYTNHYLNKLNTILNKIIDFAVVNYGLTSNPNRIIGPYKEKKDKIIPDSEKLRYITYEEFQKFISAVDDLKWKTFFTFLYYTGMRKGEILALNFNDIKGDTIIVNKTLYSKIRGGYTITSTKNNLNRTVKMSKVLIDQLNEYIEYMKSFDDFSPTWFLFGGPHFMSITTIDRMKHNYFELSGVREISIHEFRHSHVSLLANEFIKKSNAKVDTTKFFAMMSNRMGHTIDVMQKHTCIFLKVCRTK